jgi:hypothetical protein
VLAALAWSLGLFALLRTPWVEQRLVLPVTQLQAQASDYYAGPSRAPIAVTLECSGADVLALCLAAILACPVSARARLAGTAGAVAFVLGLNTVRIATLGALPCSPSPGLAGDPRDRHRRLRPSLDADGPGRDAVGAGR